MFNVQCGVVYSVLQGTISKHRLSVTPAAPVQCTEEGKVVSVGRFVLISSSCKVYMGGGEVVSVGRFVLISSSCKV